ncbi:MAG: hypothetical protein SPI30_09800 [Prevotella sp.]|nr:hypothetical protein [Prevotella sp.]
MSRRRRTTANARLCPVYNLIHADVTGMLAANTRHKLKYWRRPRKRTFPVANRTGIHQRPEEADGKRLGT